MAETRCLAWTASRGEAAGAPAAAGLSALVGGEAWFTSGLGFLGAVAAAIAFFFRPEEQALEHGAKGAACIALRNEARRFMNIDSRSGLSVDALADRVRLLAGRYDTLRAQEPLVLPDWTYQRVKDEIAAGNYGYDNDPLWTEYEGGSAST